ncbi:sigma-70 family RNA polymerase sigma factor [Sphingomonas sp. MA1305]|uniref:RNA polymerase sigma factor n=1 Tax=Sphingomonas sp. MA1305 TaxID=2479204 RepID=UPI0018DF18DE|nr:sigma-70 family RNA polymerase sigma factor [Sphingomonas sp. MA1305]MBI0475780.1 sigma-70 family RNA polymerase sigma factor [Sphingomonas sp. MA1305]
MSIIREIDVWFVEQILPHERQLLAVAMRICPSADEARDLVQDVLLRMLTLTDWESIANPLGFMRRMIRNAAIDRLRHAKVVDFQSLSEIEHVDIPDHAPDQHRVTEDRETLRRLAREVDALPERCRVVFLKCRVHGASPRAVAVELGVSLSTLEKRLARALILLSIAMTADRGDPIDDSFDLWARHRRTAIASH